MPTSRQRNREMYDRGARIYAMAANMLEGVDRGEWKARGLSDGDVMFALALGSILLRINSIELGLKHILDREMGRPVPKKHDLVILWNRLTDEWKDKVAEESCVPMEDIREGRCHVNHRVTSLWAPTPEIMQRSSLAATVSSRRRGIGGVFGGRPDGVGR